MIWFLAALLLVVSVSSTTVEEAQVEDGQEREAKILPIFQVVKFPVSLPEILKDSSVKKLKLRLTSKSEVRLQNVHIVLDAFQFVEGFDILCF